MKTIVMMVFLVSLVLAVDLQKWGPEITGLSSEEKKILLHKGTERPFSGQYTNTTGNGIYTCKLCKTPLYRSGDKFASHCGWPSFDDAIKGAVKKIPDADGQRMEIVCAKCGGHLGHVFNGEGYTVKNTRYCVNSLSLNFQPNDIANTTLTKAYFAGGCFWGVEYHLEKLKGVKEVRSGYMGGVTKNPTYEEVVRHTTGHLETVEVIYNPSVVSYETLAKAFFEIHDPTQKNGQGPDIGNQYLSAVFVNNDNESKIIRSLISQLKHNGYDVATKVLKKETFYPAEAYHQNYYQQKGKLPYCHGYVKRFK
jgi:peptide methionine sulfoxide reductase msrA/msrB